MQNEFPSVPTAELTERELEILKLLATGCSNKEIAQGLVISSNTVKVHLRNIFAKIGVASRTEAAMYAVHNGLIVTLGGGQEKEIAPSTEDISAGSQTEASRATSRLQPLIRFVTLGVILLVLVAAAGLGILLTRQPPTPSPTTYAPPTATSEPRWQILSNLPIARSDLAISTYENKIYTFGGQSSDGLTGAVEYYDPGKDTWIELAEKPVQVTDINAVVIGGKIYVPGGRLASGETTAVLEIYDPAQNSWGKGSSMPLAVSAYALAAFEGRLYLFGGWDGKNYLNSVLMYDPNLDKWSSMSPMTGRRGYAGAAVSSDKIYVIGGYDGTQALASNEIYTPHLEGIKNPWGHAEPLPAADYDIGITSVADNIYIIGGKKSTNLFLIYVPQTNEWLPFDPAPIEIGEGARMALIGQYIFVMGGMIDNAPSAHNIAYHAIYTIQIPVLIHP